MTTAGSRPQFDAPARAIREVDYGFFGPGSPTWKVWTAPTALLGFQRAVVLEHFDPDLTAAVADVGGIYSDPRGRLDHTFAYFLIAAVGDGRMAIEASEHLMQVHAKATGVEPITGKRYSANNPRSQLWIHITGWHSVLECYEMFGPGPLDPEEERRYWAECAVAAELQTCKPSDVPRSRAEVREYFAAVKPRLCSSERAHRGMHYLLRTPWDKGLRLWGGSRIVAPAVIATLPRWMREVGGFDQFALLDAAVRPAGRIAVAVLGGERAKLAVLRSSIGPVTARLYREHLDAGTPLEPVTVTPEQARARYGSAGRRPQSNVG
ncbi:oxygenase MpaB family protein [Nocardia terpenica]|uniref:Long-chain fatty acid--CoA ligase n=1 Tax=Nocardia terpenica TaxID=455432 RepID=A0A291RQ01_9NOCA|nr:oxygenase MpaB family protein [Nocardia terpenica]ATL69636.1 long-chain fatty acid--CoA ligase [Nocardia terpenica]